MATNTGATNATSSQPIKAHRGSGRVGVSDRRVCISVGKRRTSRQVIEDLTTENAALRELLSAERADNDDLRLACEIIAAPVVERVAGRNHRVVDAHILDCEGGFIDHTSLNI